MNHIFRAGLVAVLLGITAPVAHAQLEAGHLMLSGRIGYMQTKNGTGDNSTITSSGWISPQVGYFVAENFVVGLLLNYDGASTEHKSNASGSAMSNKTTTTTTTYGPFVRYYKPVGDHAAFFGQAAVLLGSQKETNTVSGGEQTANSDEKYSYFGVAVTPGFTWLPTDHFGVEVTLGDLSFAQTKAKDLPSGADEKDYTTRSIGASFGLQMLRVGAAWYIGAK